MTGALRGNAPAVNGWNAEYIEAEYQRFKADPTSVPADLRAFFQGFDLARAAAPSTGAGLDPAQLGVQRLVDSYRRFGHLAARIDPFGRERTRPAQLSLEFNGLTEADLDTTLAAPPLGLGPGVSLRQVRDTLETVYCGPIAIEFMHADDQAEIDWFIQKFEAARGRTQFSPDQKKRILDQLTRADAFEAFCQKRYPSEKRFSLEGGETLIPVLDQLLEAAADLSVEEIVLGMAHRGRLNVLNNILGKSYQQIFTEFEDNFDRGFADGGGDVKYHRGYSGERTLSSGKRLHIAMASNPSHLESVNAVVLGRCRAKQRLRADLDRVRVVPVLIHGDAAVIGQGVVSECLNFSQIEGYTAGGCVHVVINNLIGFTTVPEDSRSSEYCTDVAKIIACPILHVNGDDPEAAAFATRLCVEYRQRFKKDVFLDLYCFRKYGHNEQDDQSFTQPRLAAMIKARPSVLSVYAQRLQSEGVITEADLAAVQKQLDDALDSAQKAAKASPKIPVIDPGGARWAGIKGDYSFAGPDTGVSREVLAEVAAGMTKLPDGFEPNPRLKGVLQSRSEIARSASPAGDPASLLVTHADAEQLAFGTLLLEGVPVRLSGQDSRRGTFSQRHAVVYDFKTGERYVPLNHMRELGVPGKPGAEPLSTGSDGKPRQSRFCVYDSPLSEYSVMGFDYGYSLADPNMLICWEGQFGDFANGAQVMIDQYLASSEIKWERWSGLVLLLPHGYEGAGPEHSSARLERFLALCADDNMEIVWPTSAAQVFHMFRRQVRRGFRKPLVVMQTKKLLREPTSPLADMLKGRFQELLDDPSFAAGGADPKRVTRVVLCSGKVYYDLTERREALGRKDIAIIRLEQLYPFHTELAGRILSRYPKAAERVWVQEEPRNAGAWSYVSDLFRTDPALSALGLDHIRYIGRPPSASPAVGSKRASKDEQERYVTEAVGAKPAKAESKDAKTAVTRA